MFSLTSKTTCTIAAVIILTIGLLAGWLHYEITANKKLIELCQIASRCTLSFLMPQRSQLTATHDDENTSNYAIVKNRLIELSKRYPSARFIYLVRYNPNTGQFVYLADSDRSDSISLSRPGDAFSGDINNSDLLKTLGDGTVTYNESQSDIFGRWISVYARIDDGDRNDILRIDIPSATWRKGLWESALMRACCVWLLLGAPLLIYILTQRFSKQQLLIRKLSSAMEQSATPMLIIGANGVIEYVNSSLCDLSIYTREQLIGTHWEATLHSIPKEKVEELKKLRKEGKSWSETFTLRRKGNEVYEAIIVSTPLRDEKGRIYAQLIVITNTSALVVQAKQLREAKENAEAAAYAKSNFITTVSHEVRTPLNGIIGFANLLNDTSLDAEQRGYVQGIQTSSHLLMELAEKVLNHSYIQSGRLQLEPEPCNLRTSIQEIIETFKSAMDAKKLQITYSVSPDVPQIAFIDGTRLRQVISNLIDNAVKFTPVGYIEVTLRIVPAPTQAPPPLGDMEKNSIVQPDAASARTAKDVPRKIMLQYTVRDTGIGISPEKQSSLFKPFSQVDTSKNRTHGGVGLGLVICYDLVRLMGGTMHISSHPGKGSLFSFTLQCEPVSDAQQGHMDSYCDKAALFV